MALGSYGSWESPLSSEAVSKASIGFLELACEKNIVYWLETRPSEKGRCALISYPPEKEILPSYSVRTRVNEYGGGSFTIKKGNIYFSNGEDNRLYILNKNGHIKPLTPSDKSCRYADFIVTNDETALISVCENHSDGKTITSLVNINIKDGSIHPIVSGADFYAAPRLSPDGSFLAYLSWNFPNMPWDGTTLWVTEMGKEGMLGAPKKIAGGTEESICQPEWSGDGMLYFASDRSGYWNLYRLKNKKIEALYPTEAECALPAWVFKRNQYAFATLQEKTVIVCIHTDKGIDKLGILYPETRQLEELDLPYTVMSHVCTNDRKVFFLGSSPLLASSIIELDLVSKKHKILKTSSSSSLSLDWISIPEQIEKHFYYPPKNPHFQSPKNEMPPLIVKCHGGPTAHSGAAFRLETQFWTTRGFAVLDLNYPGSSGFGTAYRKQLKGKWGLVDAENACSMALLLVKEGKADKNRLFIKGGSAGGYTVLCALTFHKTFSGGVSYYGIGDLEMLLKDTHKFESHYLEGLVAPYPRDKAIYHERSPLYHVDQITKPLLLLQGKEDPIVPPMQAEKMFAALSSKGVPVTLLLFENEAHGFRMAETIRSCLEAELQFYNSLDLLKK